MIDGMGILMLVMLEPFYPNTMQFGTLRLIYQEYNHTLQQIIAG